MFMAFGPLFDFGFPPRVPPAFAPTCHIFYGARVIDVDGSRVMRFEEKPGLTDMRLANLGIYLFEVVVIILQAYIFTLLSAVYVQTSVHPEH